MTVSTKTRAQLHERALGCCERCGLYGANNAHHRVNQSQGGSDELSNLLLLCGSGTTGCHGWVTEHPDFARWDGLSVARGNDPSTVSVLRYDRITGTESRVYLTDDGGLVAV